MNMRDLIPWNRNEQVPGRYREESDPFMTLHREMNRLFDNVLRGFEAAPLVGGLSRMGGWPSVEVTETDNDVHVSAELPGMDEKDIEVLMNDGILTIRGEKRSEVEDKARSFSERSYGRFERRIPLPWEVEEDKIQASFRNGVLAIALPKSPRAAEQVRRIPINREETTKH
ncbi:Hsp20/alpha crystallin family protein [Microvirga brassicacearum]|uniref:Hsp20/alpha crystallin family protein n=1 Tax=Microvirga brassicacearum TaxID=2580413 RepID=A0A5N3P8W7_9HYPH|nr:Hsp20/alpha crystallin family protein [Microvirga brassicacearum]KAB0266115.1 Hsp20/alpha crystallin family protein [Microvirga brassicacearum]